MYQLGRIETKIDTLLEQMAQLFQQLHEFEVRVDQNFANVFGRLDEIEAKLDGPEPSGTTLNVTVGEPVPQ